jgi:C4-dicarboxylate-specific signal transduction histidine kinase
MRSRGRAPSAEHGVDELRRDPDEAAALQLHADRLVTLGQLAARAAHDINGQLTAAQHNVDIALHIARQLSAQGEQDVAAARLVEALDRIGSATRRIAAITHDMTLYARRPDTELAPVLLHELARDALRITAPLAGESVRVLARLEPLPEHAGNASQLIQLTVNLIVNALQALQAAGTAGATLVVETHADEDALRLAVEDNGPGVPPALRQRIFEPYFTTKPPGVGTGLGLAICQEIAQRHRGGIALVEGELGGARFELRLPRADR